MFDPPLICIFFFFNDTATTEIYTLSLHDALPICEDYIILESELESAVSYTKGCYLGQEIIARIHWRGEQAKRLRGDRKSTRLNSSHDQISYAVFCLEKKKTHSSS